MKVMVMLALRTLGLLTLLCWSAGTFAAGFGFAALPDAFTLVQGTPSTATLAVSTSALPATTLPVYPIVMSSGALPTGITASISALSLTNAGTAQVTVSSDGTTAPGIYPLEIDAGTVDLLSAASATVTLTVLPAPDFALAVTPAIQSVVQGVAAGYTVSVDGVNGFADPVTLAVTGLPAGANAVFLPGSIAGAGQSALSIGTSVATAPGSYAVTVLATSNTLQHAFQLQLTVTAPGAGYLLSVTPTLQTVQQGAAADYVISTLLADGTTAPDSNTLSVADLPPGASATFTPGATQGSTNATLRVLTSPATPPGSYTLTVSSALAPATAIQLTVTPGTTPPPGSDGDVPLPGWSLVLLALGLLGSLLTTRVRRRI